MALCVTQLAPGLWQINEPMNGAPYVDCYLLAGTQRAVLIDCLMHGGGLVELLRELTDKPIDVLITHGHGDHAGAEVRNLLDAGYTLHMSHCDVELLNGMFGGSYSAADFQPLADGQRFDLGGTVLETVCVPGHTPGSVVFLDRAHGRMFSGDSLGSTHFWMQIHGATTLAEFLPQVRRLEALCAGLCLTIYPGHRGQAAEALNERYITDVRELTEMILSGEAVGEPSPPEAGEFARGLIARHGAVAGYWYNPDRIR